MDLPERRTKAKYHGECESCYNLWTEGEHMDCIPPQYLCEYGPHTLSVAYKAALYSKFHFYCTEEVVGSFLGYNPYFPKQAEWVKK